MGQFVASLNVDLIMRVEVLVSAWACGTEIGNAWCGDPQILIDHRASVGHADAHRELPVIKGWADVKAVRGLADQRRFVGAIGKAGDRVRKAVKLGLSVAVVGRNTQSAHRSGQEGKMLLVGEFNALNVRALSVLVLLELYGGSRATDAKGAGIFNLDQRVADHLVEVACLDQSDGLQIALVKDIEVVGVFSRKMRIACGVELIAIRCLISRVPDGRG